MRRLTASEYINSVEHALSIEVEPLATTELPAEVASSGFDNDANALMGRVIYDFDDARDRPGTSGATACSHEYWHGFADAGENRQLRAHLHLMMNQIAHLMKLLDAPDAVEENGKTILENSMVIVSTESGDGRHNDSTRELTGVLHIISGGNGRFKTGQIIDVNNHGIHLYNTMLAAFGVGRSMGDGGGATIDQILA